MPKPKSPTALKTQGASSRCAEGSGAQGNPGTWWAWGHLLGLQSVLLRSTPSCALSPPWPP